MSRPEAAARVLVTLETFWEGEQGEARDAMGHRGFFYHFLDMESGRRAHKCELSTIDSTWLLAGALAAGAYFDADDPVERKVRELADMLYRRADWQWAQNGGRTVTHGWNPETGFLRARWSGYNEALLLYFLGLGSPTHPLPAESYPAWTETYRWKTLYGIELLYAGPLFIHQLSHAWIDFRGLQDEIMRTKGIDYFENSRRATYVQQRYAIRNPRGLRGYGEFIWGITASDGPGPATLVVDGIRRHFYDYVGRGVPFGPDDGTIAPWGVIASLPFAPEIVLPTIERIDEEHPEMVSDYGFKCSFNPTYQDDSGDSGWVSKGYYGLDQGPIVLMIENDRSGFLWRLMERSPYIVTGLRRAGFRGGWLDGDPVGGPGRAERRS